MAQVAWFPVDPNNGEAEAHRFLPPPGIHPNSAVFGGVNLPKPLTWQQREHIDQRRNILGRIGQLLMRNAQLVVSGGGDLMGEQMHKTWALARKLEVLLFLHSASLLEYCNIESLTRRVQALTASIVNKKIRKGNGAPNAIGARSGARAAVEHRHTRCGPSPTMAPTTVRDPTLLLSMARPSSATSSKRSASDMTSTIDYPYDLPPLPLSKRVRLLHEQTVCREHLLGGLLFRGYEELCKLIWSYVEGVQIMRMRSVCRAGRVHVPLFVTSLQISCNSIQRALTTYSIGSGGCILRECINLQQLDVVSLSSGMTFGKLSMRAMNCPQRFVVTHDDHEQIVLALSEQLRLNAFPRLVRLGLTCLFTNEEADGEADVLLNNLMTGCSPQLEELCLPGNSFGDYGAIKLAQMLRSRVCPKLTRLDLRRNFIAEQGVRSLCHALADGCAPNLVELCLGGNTITDSCFHHILFAMESRQLSKLRFLGIEMNYLTATSMEMLGRTIGKMVCPELSQVSYSDNSCADADAKRLIATAVYQERMFRLQQQQMRIAHSQIQSQQSFQEQMGLSVTTRHYSSEDDDEDQFSSDGE